MEDYEECNCDLALYLKQFKPKYDVGKEVFFMENNKVDSANVTSVSILVTKRGIDRVLYKLEGKLSRKQERQLFSTKAELINNLIGEELK
jgi:hypothetical protein